MGRRALRASAATLLCVVLGLLAGAGSADAHAALIATEPGQGALVPTLPSRVSLTFSEPVVVATSGIRVFGPDGSELDNGHTVHVGQPSSVGVGLSRSAPPVAQGTYTVSWRVISADSHPVAGAFTFSVGHPSAGRVPPGAQPTGSATLGVGYALVRAAAFASFALLVGSIGFVLLCWPGAIARRETRRIVLAGWAGLLASTMATLLLQGPYGNGLGLDRLFDPALVSETLGSPLGAALTGRLALLALAGGFLVLLCAWLEHLGRRGRVWFGALGSVLALGLAATWSAGGHAAVGVQPELALPADIVHLMAMGLWLGGLVTLIVLIRPASTADAELPTITDPAVYRFSTIATGSIMVLIGTGSYQSWRQLGSWAAFGSTDYGRLLLVKLVGVALMLSVAALSHRSLPAQRRDAPGLPVLRRSVLGEAALGALVLGVTAMLINAEPGRTTTAASAGPVHQVISYDTGGPNGRGRLIVDINPAATGPNLMHITAQDPRGIPTDVAELRAQLILTARQLGPFTIPLRHTAPGEYAADGIQLPYRGPWRLTVTVRTSEIDETVVAAPVAVR